MQAVVLVPTFDRPEMLWLCLDHLSRCHEARSIQVRVFVDGKAGHAPLDECIAAVAAQHGVLSATLRVGQRHSFSGNSFNVLNAYRDAYADGFDLIYLVEDDVMVSPEFFAWHQAVHALPLNAATSVGVRAPEHGAYASLGVCHERGTVADILVHAVGDYFRDMAGYCRRHFPPSPFGHEQDGLIARVLSGRTVAWADPPVCSHVGWYGYHRKKTDRPTGTLEERYRQVRAAVEAGLPGTVADVSLATECNNGTYTLTTVPGAAA